MEYRYSPIYKYIVLFIVIFLFFKHQKIIQDDLAIVNAIIITLMLVTFDYILIKDHPGPFKSTKEDFDSDTDSEIEKIEWFDDDDDEKPLSTSSQRYKDSVVGNYPPQRYVNNSISIGQQNYSSNGFQPI